MAWFPCNIGGGGPSGIANILKGTSDPASSIGDNGQLYLKYADLSLREYIEVGSTSGPYINTGFYWSSDCEFEIKAKWTGTPANNTAFFGAYSPNQDTDVQVYNGNTLFYVGGGGTASLSIDTNDHIYKATQSELLLDGTNVATPNWSRVPTSLEVSIFTMQQHSPAINARIYYIKIWKNGELHKYFIPAINNATNEIGMFEAVSGEFYSNDGSGDFDISSSVISDMPSRPILSSFAKVDNAWQDLIDTNIDDILAGGSKYIKATGLFTSASSAGQKVEVDCGFKPDLVMVDMEFGNGFTRSTYLSTAWYEETDHPASVWDLRPMENVIYAITPGSVTGETGITDLTDTGFKYRSNGSNTVNKACTYTAIKFDADNMEILDRYTMEQGNTLTAQDEASVNAETDKLYMFFTGNHSGSFANANVLVGNTSYFEIISGIGIASAIIQATSDTVTYDGGYTGDYYMTEVDIFKNGVEDLSAYCMDRTSSWVSSASISANVGDYYLIADTVNNESGTIIGADTLIEETLTHPVQPLNAKIRIIKATSTAISLSSGNNLYYRRFGLFKEI